LPVREPLPDGVEYAVHEADGIGGAEGAGQFQRFVDDNGRRSVRTIEELVDGETQNQAVDDGEAERWGTIR